MICAHLRCVRYRCCSLTGRCGRGLANQRGGRAGEAVTQICGDLHVCAVRQKYTRHGCGRKLGGQASGPPPAATPKLAQVRPTHLDTAVIMVIMHRSGNSNVDTVLDGLTWSRPGSVQVRELVVGWADGPAARRRRLCKLALRGRSSTCRGMHTCRLKGLAFAGPSWRSCGLQQGLVYMDSRTSSSVTAPQAHTQCASKGGFGLCQACLPLSSGHRNQCVQRIGHGVRLHDSQEGRLAPGQSACWRGVWPRQTSDVRSQ